MQIYLSIYLYAMKACQESVGCSYTLLQVWHQTGACGQARGRGKRPSYFLTGRLCGYFVPAGSHTWTKQKSSINHNLQFVLIININHIQLDTTQLMISLRCISYIVSFNDMFRLQLWATFGFITFLSKVNYTISNAIVIVTYEILYNVETF